jgi:predicted metal-dependent hydrolase
VTPTLHHLAAPLRLLTGREIDIALDGTDSVPVRAEIHPSGAFKLRLHPCFQLAAEEVLRALAAHLRQPRRETAHALREFVRAARVEIPAKRLRRPRLQPVGQHFDLRAIRDQVNREHFAGVLRTAITWGRSAKPRRRRRRSIVFGSYDFALDLVRIHPELDSPKVPRHFVEYIVFHELLHAVHPVRIRADGRRSVHTPEFRRHEQRYPDLERAMKHLRKWEGA